MFFLQTLLCKNAFNAHLQDTLYWRQAVSRHLVLHPERIWRKDTQQAHRCLTFPSCHSSLRTVQDFFRNIISERSRFRVKWLQYSQSPDSLCASVESLRTRRTKVSSFQYDDLTPHSMERSEVFEVVLKLIRV